MEHSNDRILTTHVGSLPRPEALAEALQLRDRGELPVAEEEDFPGLVKDAVTEVVRKQVEAGVDVVSDGEMSKFGYATYVKERLSGFEGEPEALALADLADFPDYAARVKLEITTPSCIGPVEYRGRASAEQDTANFGAALAVEDAAGAFMNAASPGVISEFLKNRYYGTDEEYLYALADAMKQEYEAIVGAGILLQLDCPDLAMGRHLHVPPLEVGAFRKQVEERVEVINHATRDIPPERMRLHVCWGNYESPHHHDVPLADVIDIILRARPAHLLVEAANPRHEHEWRIFEDVALPEGKVLVPGVIDTLTNYIEHPELVAQRIIRYAELVGRENVMAGTDCGFATFANFVNVDPAIAWAKLGALAEGAELASGRMWRTPGKAAG